MPKYKRKVYKRKVEEIEAVTFEEFVVYGLNFPGVNIVGGMPWSFEYNGAPVTHETDDRYLITLNDNTIVFDRSDVLITKKDGTMSIMDKSMFFDKHERVNNRQK